MFFVRVYCLLLILDFGRIQALNVEEYIRDNIKQLKKLLEKKKTRSASVKLEVLFNEHADDAQELLQTLEKDDNTNQNEELKKDIVMQIASHMTQLQKLLTMMSNKPLALNIYCRDHRGAHLWQNLCSNRPSKKILKPDATYCRDEHLDNSLPVKIRYIHTTEEDFFKADPGK